MNSNGFKTLYFLFVIIFIFSVSLAKTAEIPGEFSGEVNLENRFYFAQGVYGNTKQLENNLSLKPEYSFSWEDDRKVITVIPYAVLSNPDSKKSHFDLREASYIAAYDTFEITVGVSKVFWGVTESQHLVDVINQTDLVMNSDGEDKLGQPMLSGTYISDYGNLSLFVLPYFRERSFPGVDGRFRSAFTVDASHATYESDDEEKHIDFAGRYSHSIENLDLGLSLFKGTDREPTFILNGTALRPHYIQTTQVGVDLQYIFESWIFKFEGVNKTAQLWQDYSAATYGFEYTFSNIDDTGLDIGVIAEHLLDSRDEVQTVFKNHTFIGSRLALNDEDSTELLVGAIVDNDSFDLTSLRAEGSRRINENWKWEVEASAIVKTESSDILNSFEKDDYMQFSISYFF